MAVTAPISPRPVIGDEPDRLPAYVSNGMVGLRVMAVPLRPGLTMLNGLSSIHPVLGVEYSPQAPYPLAGDLEVNGVRLSVRPECARLIEQRYDFSCAELVSRFRRRARRHRVGRRGVDAGEPFESMLDAARGRGGGFTLVRTGADGARRYGRCARPLRGASCGCAVGSRGMRSRTVTFASSRPVRSRPRASPTPPNCSAHRMPNGTSPTGPATATWRRPIGCAQDEAAATGSATLRPWCRAHSTNWPTSTRSDC